MVTITPSDNKLSTLLTLRQEFFKKLNRYKRNKNNGDLSIKYFANIEFTQSCIPHLHIQFFYTNINPIQKAYNSVVSIKNNNTHTNNISIANNHNYRFTYVIKDYILLDITTEKIKAHYKGVKYISSSQKSISNKIVKYLFNTITFKTTNRYKEILLLIDEGRIKITKEDTTKSDNTRFTKLKSKKRIGSQYVLIFIQDTQTVSKPIKTIKVKKFKTKTVRIQKNIKSKLTYNKQSP